MTSFAYSRPTTLHEAVHLLRDLRGDGLIFAGGTDIIPMLRAGQLTPKHVVDVKVIDELNGISSGENGEFHIGAATPVHELENHPRLQGDYPALAEAAALLGSYPVRCRATVGGNVCRASPSADLIPPLLIYEAVARITGPDASRDVPLGELFVGPGQTVLAADEILVEFVLPAKNEVRHWRSTYVKHSPRRAMDLAVVGIAMALGQTTDAHSELRIALGAASPTPIRATTAEQAWRERGPLSPAEVGALAEADCQPISDLRGTENFRRYLVRELVAQTLEHLSSGA